jgi:serine protease
VKQALRRVLALFVLFLPALSSEVCAQAIRTESFRGRDVVAGEVIVRFREGSTPGAAAADTASDIVTAGALTPARATLLRSRSRNVSELLQEYSSRPDVLYAEPNYLWRKKDVPNDPFFSSQWSLSNTGQQISGQNGIAGADIGAIPAWDITQGSRSIVIGIVDSGIDYNHPDLASNIWSAPRAFTVNIAGQPITCAAGTHGFNAITRTCDPMDDDGESHGTHVAGIIGADGDNGLGISGINRVASMMALKFIGSSGSGTTADAIAAIEFAIQAKAVLGVDANVRILNNSWGSNAFSQSLLDAVNSAATNNILFVAAAGNDGINTDQTPHYPSSYTAANIISVASTTNRDELYEFSNFGPVSVDLGAPGYNIGSTRSPMTYIFEGGTSMAAAMVSGAAGLVLSACNLSTGQLRALLFSSVDPVASLQGRTATGGRLNVHSALASCGSSPVFTLRSQSSFVLPDTAGSATATITMNPLNGFSGNVNLTASVPQGFTFTAGSSVIISSSPSTTLTFTADSSVVPGTYVIHVTGEGGGTVRTAGFVFIVGAPISPGQVVSGTWSVNTSQPDRFRSGLQLGLADWYQVTLNSSTSLEISLFYTVSNSNQLRLFDSSGTELAVAGPPSNNILQISRLVAPGSYSIVVSTGSTFSSSNSYSLAVNTPLLRSLNPNGAQQGSTSQVQLSGSQFASGLTVDAGNDIAVSNVVFNSPQSATATFTISLNAVLGNRPVTVSTSSGRSNPVTFTVTQPRPIITSVTPASAVVGTSVDISILGDNFVAPIVEFIAANRSGITLDNVLALNTTQITARITIDPTAMVQNISIRVTTLGGFTTIPFQILPLPPILTSISPPSGSLGTTVDVTLTGENFFGPMTVDAGSGITVQNISISLQSGLKIATARFNISPATTLGIRNVTVTTAGGTSSVVIFTVIPGPSPTLTSISPVNWPQTTTLNLDVNGTNFTTGLAFNVGPDIAVTSITIVSGTRATITVQIGATAALGPREATITTPGGASNSIVFTILPPPPTLTSIGPSSGVQQSTANVTLTGTNFVQGLTIQGLPLTFSQITVIDSTSATAVVTIPVSTGTGNYDVRVTTASGTTGPVAFTVLPGIPTLTEIRPSFAIRGRSNSMTLVGTNFATGSTTISPVPGVVITIQSVSGGSLTANFVVDATASLGSYSVTLTTPGGTTGAVAFSIFDPFPDLSVSGGAANLFAGFNGTYGFGLSNNGTAAATTPITITDTLPAGLTFVSASGPGFSCSASGQVLTCTYANLPFTPLSIAGVSITVAVSASAPASSTHTFSVSYAEDLQPSNNSDTATITVQQPPTPVLTFAPTNLTAGQQATVSVAIPTPLPQAVTGTLNVSFSSSASNPGDDPAIQFATGGRQVSFVIPANTTQARFGSSTLSGPIGFQTGTVAGSIDFSGVAQMGTVQKLFSSTPGTTSLTIAPAAPVLQSVRRDVQSGVGILITSSSTARSVTEMILQFSTTPTVDPSCGSVAGCTASGSTLTLDVKTLFDTWFSRDSQFGSLNTLRIPLVIQGNLHGSLSVTFKNALGSSNAMSVSF